MSRPTATPASKSRHNHQPTTLMPPASQVTPVTSPPGTISRFFGSMFRTTSFFRQELHNDDNREDSDILNPDNSSISSTPIFTIHQTVLYIKQVPPIPVIILDIDYTEPSLLCFTVQTQQGHVFDTVSRFLCIIPDHVANYIASFPRPPLEISVGDLTPIHHFPTLDPTSVVVPIPSVNTTVETSIVHPPSTPPAGLASTFSAFTPSTAATLHAVVTLSQRDQTALVTPPSAPALLFDGTPAKMKDLQCQFAEHIDIRNYAKTGFLLIPDADGICRDIFQDSTYLLMEDFVRANDLLLANTSPAGAALRQVSLLLFQRLQNFCTPTFQTTMRANHKLFYKTSFLLYYGTMLERCQLTGIGSIIDVETYRDQLSKSALIALFKRHNFDVILLFSDITRLMAHLLRLGHSKEDMTGTTIQVLTTSPNTSFTRFMDNHRRAFLLKEAPYHATATDTSKFDALHKSASNEYLLLHKDGRYYKAPVSDADGFVLLAGVHNKKRSSASPTAPAAALCTNGETYANKATWEFLCPGPGKPLSKHVENRNWWWCTNHTNHSACTFKNTGQWVQHSPADCRSGTRRGSGRSSRMTGISKPTMPASATTTVPTTTPTNALSSSTVTTGAPLKMRSELASILASGDPTQVACLYAAFQATSNTDIDPGESL